MNLLLHFAWLCHIVPASYKIHTVLLIIRSI